MRLAGDDMTLRRIRPDDVPVLASTGCEPEFVLRQS
jgi:hypothetical protein